MKFCALISALAGLLAGAGMHLGLPATSGPVYTIAQVEIGLFQNAPAWTDRTFLLRGTAVRYSCLTGPWTCGPQDFLVEDAGPAPPSGPLPLAGSDHNSALAFLLRIPWLRGLLPWSPVVLWDVPATYRVRLQPLPCGTINPGCYEAVPQFAAL